MDIFDQIYLKERPISLPMVTMSTIKQKYDKWGYVRKINKIEICEYFGEWSKYYAGLSPPMEKLEKPKNINRLNFDECLKWFYW